MVSWVKKIALLFAACAVLLIQQLGWFSQTRGWEDVTGFSALSQNELPTQYTPSEAEPELYWLGHSGFLLQWHSTRLLLDPILSSHCTIAKRLSAAPLQPHQLGQIDAVVLSHAHYDHMDLPTLNAIENLATIVLPRGSEIFLSESLRTRTKVVGLVPEETFSPTTGVEITAVPAVHNGARNHPFSSSFLANGYIIKVKGVSLYFAGDTGWGEHFAEIRTAHAPQIAILPIGGFEPYFVLKNYHLSPEDAVRAATVLGVEKVFPAHFGTFRVAFDFPETALKRFARSANVLWHMPQIAAAPDHDA